MKVFNINKNILGNILNSTESLGRKDSTFKIFGSENNSSLEIKHKLTQNISYSNETLSLKSRKVNSLSDVKTKSNLRRNLLSKKTEREEFKDYPNHVTLPTTQSLDQIYMKLKMQELNEDFERRQKMLELDKKISNIEAEYTEPNVYRKIITISISLIVTGLLLGVLLGLILVMYLNSKK